MPKKKRPATNPTPSEEQEAEIDKAMEWVTPHLSKPGRIAALFTATDREYVIIIQALFEGLVKEILMTHFRSVSKLEEKRLTKLFDRALRDFYVLHDLCGALNLIGPETCSALSTLRDIRIKAAHLEDFQSIAKDHLNAMGSACPTHVKHAKSLSARMPLHDVNPNPALSEQRIEFMEIAQQLHVCLLSIKLHLERGDPFPTI